MPHMLPIDIDRLKILYFEERKTVREIAVLMKCGRSTILDRLGRFGEGLRKGGFQEGNLHYVKAAPFARKPDPQSQKTRAKEKKRRVDHKVTSVIAGWLFEEADRFDKDDMCMEAARSLIEELRGNGIVPMLRRR